MPGVREIYSLTASFHGNNSVPVSMVDSCHFEGLGSLIVVSYCSIALEVCSAAYRVDRAIAEHPAANKTFLKLVKH